MKHIFVRPQKLISTLTELGHNSSLVLLVRSLVITLGIFSGLTVPASAQIVSEKGSSTIVSTPSGNATITGGEGGNGQNLFHSFETFNVTKGNTANFIPNLNTQNIFGRINNVVPSPSLIDGKIQVTGGSLKGVNLYLMNPAGIVFGANASLDINGAFTATTAKAIGFGDNKWFSAFGDNKYTELTGNPSSFAFTGSTPGNIFSAATFDASPVDPTKQTTKSGKSITLVGGTVISTGDIKTAGGNISIATVKDGQYVKIKVEGSILSLELPTALPPLKNLINPTPSGFTPLSLAGLLTNSGLTKEATGVIVDSSNNNVVKLVGDTRSILAGDIVTKNLDTSGNPNGGNVSLNTQAGDIIVNSIDTRSVSSSKDGGNGGDVTINAGGIFRATGFTLDSGNFTVITRDKNGNEITQKISGLSIFTGGNRADTDLQDTKESITKEDLRGGKININFKGKSSSFVVGVVKDEKSDNDRNLKLLFDPGFTFPEGASGTRGAVISRNSNSLRNVVFRDGAFVDQDGKSAGGFGIKGDDGGGGGKPSNSDEQASRPKSKENCTPSSTSVASNPTAAPTRSAGNPNTVSADPCQPNTGNNGILQILTDRE